MPARKRARQDSDDDVAPSQSQASQRSASSSGQAEGKEQLLGNVMRLILFKHTKKLPVRHAELTSEIKKRGVAKDIIAEAKSRFQNIFGYDLCELPSWARSQAPGAKKTAGVYILLNNSKEADDKETMLQPAEGEYEHLGMTMTVLAIIQLNKGEIKEGALLQHLSDLGLDKTTATTTIKTLISQMYIVKERPAATAGEDEHEYIFTRGARAEMECSEADVFTWIAKGVMGDEVNDVALKHYQKKMLARQEAAEAEPPSASQRNQRRPSSSQR